MPSIGHSDLAQTNLTLAVECVLRTIRDQFPSTNGCWILIKMCNNSFDVFSPTTHGDLKFSGQPFEFLWSYHI